MRDSSLSKYPTLVDVPFVCVNGFVNTNKHDIMSRRYPITELGTLLASKFAARFRGMQR